MPIKGCINIDDFSEKVEQKLNTNCQVALFSSLDKNALRPGLSIKELLKTDELKKNSDESPLFVKLIPISQDSISSKTIYIREIKDGRPVDRFTEFLVDCDADVKEIYRGRVRGHILLGFMRKIPKVNTYLLLLVYMMKQTYQPKAKVR